jgi:NADPH:quinone reductase-like Zn-dependent oxidoreductase
MQAIVRERYGKPDVLELREIDEPVPGPAEVLVRVRAAALNPLDWHELTGKPRLVRLQGGLRRPKSQRLGVDLAGEVTAVGDEVTRFKPGDAVFGMRTGAFAEYVCVREAGILTGLPEGIGYEQAAAVPVAGFTALQGLYKGRIQSGQRVLVNGASGGVGTFAVQIAKAYGAHVTGVCSARNVELVKSLGADRVIDYAEEDFARGRARYDLVLDAVGTRSIRDRRRILSREGTLVAVSVPKDGWPGPLTATGLMIVAARLGVVRAKPMLTRPNPEDLTKLRELLDSGSIRSVIERTYTLDEVPEALRHLGTGRVRGKLVVTM